ncbi:MAG: aspartate kinase [Gammaproteobacteria bacterium]|nr:aspartate kinase [Gammaproteobacteria bacterium]
MALIVQKFGGSSVANIDCINNVADTICKAVQEGHQVVVVLSAMAGETDRLLGLAHSVDSTPNCRELDVLLSTGEQVSIAILSMVLTKRGYPARSYTGSQVHILTDNAHTKARIVDIKQENLRRDLAEGYIAVVAGFQGVDERGNITTLGRGGSDTTAVALAAALGAHECQIFTDVDGVYTTDPRVEPSARRMDKITFEEMLELASLGAKVLQIRAVEFAGRYNVSLRVLSSFKEGPGTLITYEDTKMEKPMITGIAFNRNEAKVSVLGVPDQPGIAAKVINPISEANIVIDMILQNSMKEGFTDFTFTVNREDLLRAQRIVNDVAKDINAREVIVDNKIVKISIVGVGMRSHAGIASTMFTTFGREGINMQLISTSEIKVSVVVDEKYLELGVRALHAAFKLDKAPQEELEI